VTSDKRRHQRFPVRIKVRFHSALEFVSEYADNLSAGGLFVRGAQKLDPLTEVQVELALPGYGTHSVRARVAHIVSDEAAAASGRRPGAGVEIVDPTDGFDDVLGEYLRRLGRRRDVAVLVEGGRPFELLSAAGYQVAELPPPHELVSAMARSQYPVLAVVVTPAKEPIYRPAAALAGVADLVRQLDESQLDDLLASLDELL
jgi:uncharacterized protein (TIGR02266 family)